MKYHVKLAVVEAIAARAQQSNSSPEEYERAIEAARAVLQQGRSESEAVRAGWDSLKGILPDFREVGAVDMSDDGVTVVIGCECIRITHAEAEKLQTALYGYGYERDAMMQGRHFGDDSFPF
jgi:hypothetical protein